MNPSIFSVSLSQAASDTGTDQLDTDDGYDGSDDNDREIIFDEDPNREDREGDDDLDDTVVMGENPPITSLHPQTLVNLREQSRFEPGMDELGAVDPERRKISPFRYPWQFTDKELQVHTRLSKIQFLDFVEKCRNANIRQRKLNLHSQCLMFHLKISHATTDEQLSSFFGVSHVAVQKIVLRVLMHQFMHRNNIPVIIRPDGTVNVEEKNKLFEFAHANTPAYFRTLVADMEDPTGRNRTGVLLNIDATYFYSQGSSDIHHQKQVYCNFKSHHIIKFLNLTDMRGKFLAVIPLAGSHSPASGYHHLVQRFSDIQDNNVEQENYLRAILQGTDRHFCIAVADAGFTTDLRNKPREVQNAPTFAELCQAEGAMLLHTSETNETYVLTRSANNRITKDYSNNPEITQVENRIKFTRCLRTVQEQIHAALKKNILSSIQNSFPTAIYVH